VQEFFDLVEEGRALPLDLPEIRELIDLAEKIRKFISKGDNEIKKGPQIDHLQNLLELVTLIVLDSNIYRISWTKSSKNLKKVNRIEKK
jgi:hypothetical protein